MDEFTALPDVRDIRPAMVATGIWLGVGVALDVYLIAKRKECLITDVLRTPPGKVFLAVLGLHVVNCLGKADPFRAAAYLINTRLAKAADTAATALTDALPG